MKAISMENMIVKWMATDALEWANEMVPIKDFNSLCNSIFPKSLNVLASRPSMGKTTLLLNMLVHRVIKRKEKVLFLSLGEPTKRMVNKVREVLYANNAIELTSLILINPEPFDNLDQVESFIEQVREEENIDGVYVDDIVLLSDRKRYGVAKCENDFGYLSTVEGDVDLFQFYLYNLTKKTDLFTVLTDGTCISQRDTHEGQPPELDRLKSKNLTELADLIVTFSRPAYYFTEEEWDRSNYLKMRLNPVKNKVGSSGIEFELELINGCY